MSKQSDSDLVEVLASAEAAFKALEPAINKYKRVSGSDNYTVGTYIMAAKSCLQNLIDSTSGRIKASVQEPCQLDSSKPVITLSEAQPK